jgi:peptidoglycan/LPS O-acetylase OafA/YrhL
MQHWQPSFNQIASKGAKCEASVGRWYFPLLTAALLSGLWLQCRLIGFGADQAASFIRGGAELFKLASLSIWIVLVPILFSFTRNNRLGRAVGELSYPVYLLHFTIVLGVSGLLAMNDWTESFRGEISAMITVLLALLLQVLLLDKFEARRQASTNRNAVIAG